MEEELLIIEQEDKEIATVEEQNEEEILTFEEGTGEGTSNYNNLTNKPKINNVELLGNKNSKDLKLQDEMDSLTNLEIEEILNSFV